MFGEARRSASRWSRKAAIASSSVTAQRYHAGPGSGQFPGAPSLPQDRHAGCATLSPLPRFLTRFWRRTRDLWQRCVIVFFAGISALGAGLAWRNMGRTAELQIRLVRASELNSHLNELNLAAAGLAHETRNPLNIIRGLAQVRERGRADIGAERVAEEHRGPLALQSALIRRHPILVDQLERPPDIGGLGRAWRVAKSQSREPANNDYNRRDND